VKFSCPIDPLRADQLPHRKMRAIGGWTTRFNYFYHLQMAGRRVYKR